MGKRPLKKLKEDILDLTVAGVELGVGTSLVSGAAAGTAVAHTAAGALTSVSAQMPLLGTVTGLGAVVGTMEQAFDLEPSKRRRR